MRRRHSEDSTGAGVQLGLIVTPMLDMSFQLMAFFIMAYNPAATEGHIPGSLAPPETYAKKSKDPNPVPSMETPLAIPEDDIIPELQEAITVKVKAITKEQQTADRFEGSIGQISVKTSLETIDPPPLADIDVKLDVALRRLEDKLTGLANATNKDGKGKNNTHLKIAADGDLRQEYVMKIYDAGKKAGYVNIHFVPPPVLNEKFKK